MKRLDAINQYRELIEDVKVAIQDINKEFKLQINLLPIKDKKITVNTLFNMIESGYYKDKLSELDGQAYIHHGYRNKINEVKVILEHLLLSNPLKAEHIEFCGIGEFEGSISVNEDNSINVYGYTEGDYQRNIDSKTYFIKVPLYLLDVLKEDNEKYKKLLKAYVENELLVFTEKIDMILESREKFRLMQEEKDKKAEQEKIEHEKEHLKELIIKYPDIVNQVLNKK